MRKIIILIALMLSIATPAMSWESTVGVGYDHRHFGHDDQIGAVSPASSLHPISSSGFRLSGSWTSKIIGNFHAGAEISLGHGWLRAPHQNSYFTKTAGNIDTSDLVTRSVLLSGKFRTLEHENHIFFLKPGVLVLNVASGWDSVDTDTGAVIALEIASKLSESNRFTVDVQAILSPTVRGRSEYDLSFGLVLGLQHVFTGEPDPEVSKPVRVSYLADSVEPKKAVNPSVLQSASTKNEALSQKNEQVSLPADPTPITLPQVSVKHKATLKLGVDGRLSPDSYPMIQKVLDAHNLKPSTIRIQHKSDEQTKKMVDEIVLWLLDKGCDKKDIVVSLNENLEKPLKISVDQK
jgi:hypothetical protein